MSKKENGDTLRDVRRVRGKIAAECAYDVEALSRKMHAFAKEHPAKYLARPLVNTDAKSLGATPANARKPSVARTSKRSARARKGNGLTRRATTRPSARTSK